MRINQNIAAFNAYRNLTTTQGQLSKSLEKLSSGFRINRAADDAAGLVISEGLRAQIGGLKQATRNAQDGISVVQTAEGALTEVHAMLQRMRELAVQSANDSNDSDSRAAAQAEVEQLLEEVERVAQQTSFGKVTLLDGSFGQQNAKVAGIATTDDSFTAGDNEGKRALDIAGLDITVDGNQVVVGDLSTTALDGTAGTFISRADLESGLQGELGGNYSVRVREVAVDPNDADVATWEITISRLDGDDLVLAVANAGNTGLAAGTYESTGAPAVFQVGANQGDTINFSIGDMTNLGISAIDVSTQSGAEAALSALDDAIADVSSERGKLGAIQNRLESTIANLQVTAENVQASESRIRDTDMALEMVEFTRAQILQQAGTVMLAQANLVPQTVLGLLQ